MRQPDKYGQDVTTTITAELVDGGFTIVSGLAFGIDKIAHETALEYGGKTVAVMATGLDTVYPAAHRPLAVEIKKQGVLLTEFAPGVRGEPYRFIQRNRIISGLSQATVVMQAASKSGALATARFATEQGRDLFVVPGPITSEKCVGTNNLLSQGAAPALSGNQIMQYLQGSTTVEQMEIPLRQQKRVSLEIPFSEEERKVYDLFPVQGIITMDTLSEKGDFEIGALIEMLFDLELRGIIKMGAGNCYERAL